MTTLRKAVETVCEGFTLPHGARKILETALWAKEETPPSDGLFVGLIAKHAGLAGELAQPESEPKDTQLSAGIMAIVASKESAGLTSEQMDELVFKGAQPKGTQNVRALASDREALIARYTKLHHLRCNADVNELCAWAKDAFDMLEADAQQAPIAFLPAYELDRLNSGHNASVRSAKFGPSHLDGDVPVYLKGRP